MNNLKELSFHKNITFFAGENGSGKSTLLEALAVASGFNAEGGSRNYSFSTFSTESELHSALTLIRGYKRPAFGYFLRAESFYNVATKEMEYSDMGHPSQHYHENSHGEGFLKLIQNNFTSNGLYLMDEPESALSPLRQLTLLLEIAENAKRGSQFIIATHSPILLGIPGCEILSFDDGKIAPCRYEDTESYIVTKMFLNNREGMLRELFKSE